MPGLEPDLNDARRFLELLDHDAKSFVFQVFDDSPKKRRELARTIPGPLDLCAHRLRRIQESGGGVYITINATVGGRRTAQHVKRVRANFADLDGSPLDPVLACGLAPHIVVESSPGRFHPYWIVEGLPLVEFTPVQKALAHRFGADPKGLRPAARDEIARIFLLEKSRAVPVTHHPDQQATTVSGRGNPCRISPCGAGWHR
jgi:hypothetical protein